MKKRRILMGKTHLIAGAVMLAVAGGQLSAQTVAPKKAKAYMVADAHLDTQWNWDIQTTIGKSSVSCPLKPSDSAPLC